MFLKEQRRYTKKDLIFEFGQDENKAINIIKQLKEYNVIKMVKATPEQKDLSDLLDSDIEIADVEANDSQYYYVPTYVGIIIVNDLVLKFYPKYFNDDFADNLPSKSKFKTIVKVLEKYNKSKEQIIKIVNDTEEKSYFNMLAIELFLLRDYFENGPYTNSRHLVETNGTGEILWEKTVNETYALISRNKPYYTELKTNKTVNDNYNYIKKFYEFVLTEISKNFNKELSEIFDIPLLELSEENLVAFGDKEYIMYKIEQELNVEFNSRKQMILKLLYAYISRHSFNDTIGYNISMFGTNNFNLVWEDVCKKVLNDMLDKPLNTIINNLNIKYKDYKTMRDIIEPPVWSEVGKINLKTFEPDLITINNNKFIILDAKYYCPKFKIGKIEGQPGIEAITKQYMYQLAFTDFISDHNLSVVNSFIFPSDDLENFDNNIYYYDKGSVFLEMMENLNVDLMPINIKFLQASKFYDMYLNNIDTFDFSLIGL